MKLNKEKCIFGESQVKFLGHIVSSDGIKADPAKISAVCDMPIPENKKTTRVSVDASSHSLGAILEQKDTDAIWKPVGFPSRSLTSAERNYAQI